MNDESLKWFKYAIDFGEYDPIRSGSIDGTDKEPHDRAIIRAINSKYIPNKNLTGKPQNSLFIGRLHIKTIEKTLNQEFNKFGNISNCKIIRDKLTGISKRYGFIEFDKYNSAIEAHKEMHLKIIDESEIIVEFECGRTLKGWKPRRLGGGFGGRKESGQLRFGGRARPFQKPITVTTIPTNFRDINRLHKKIKAL